ncbi:MAG: cbb3-type cytochrome oxidase assembly protein [bacterium]|nr:cbb3-type cytochrome oxidase assembly protein [bacterium]
MKPIVFMIIALLVMFGLSAVWGLAWAVRTGQFRNLGAAARSIFDEDEPIGRVTDAFPPAPAETAGSRSTAGGGASAREERS